MIWLLYISMILGAWVLVLIVLFVRASSLPYDVSRKEFYRRLYEKSDQKPE